MNSTVPSTYDTRCLCRSTAAFGAPVVPLVKSRIAVSSGSIDQGASRIEAPSARTDVSTESREATSSVPSGPGSSSREESRRARSSSVTSRPGRSCSISASSSPSVSR